MAYTIKIKNKTIKQITNLEKNIAQKIYSLIDSLKLNPRPYGTKKLKSIEGYRLKVGKYRILYTIDDLQNMVTVYRV